MGVKLDPESVVTCGPRILAVFMFRLGTANILGPQKPQENRHPGAERCSRYENRLGPSDPPRVIWIQDHGPEAATFGPGWLPWGGIGEARYRFGSKPLRGFSASSAYFPGGVQN